MVKLIGSASQDVECGTIANSRVHTNMFLQYRADFVLYMNCEIAMINPDVCLHEKDHRDDKIKRSQLIP